MNKLVWIGLVVGAIGCKQEVGTSVLCEIKDGPTVECTVKQTKGTAEIEVCWDYKAVCTNKATLEAPKTCAKVKDGGTATASTAKDKLTITGECDANPVGSVTNLTINGEAAK